MAELNLRQNQKRPVVWAIGGGKGGVGKSLVSVLIALELARNNEKTILVDGDLGGANLHTLMGIKTPDRTLNDFINRSYKDLHEICVSTPVANLDLICGASEVLTMANPQYAQKNKIMQGVMSLSADHVVIDLGAGTSYNVLDFFLIAHKPIVVLTPQPISIQNAYAFVRNAIYRKLSRMVSQKPSLHELIKVAMNPKNESKMRTIRDLLDAVQKSYGKKITQEIVNAISEVQPLLITNFARDNRDANAGKIVKLVAEKYLTVNAKEIGAIEYDPIMEKKISQMVPISKLDAVSPARVSIAQIISHLFGRRN